MKKEKPYARPPMQSLAPPISSLAMLQNIEKIAREVQFFSSLLVHGTFLPDFGHWPVSILVVGLKE